MMAPRHRLPRLGRVRAILPPPPSQEAAPEPDRWVELEGDDAEGPTTARDPVASTRPHETLKSPPSREPTRCVACGGPLPIR